MLNNQLSLLAELIGVIAVAMLLGLSPRFKRRPLAFKYPRREALISLILVILLTGGLWLIFTRWTMDLSSAAAALTFNTGQLTSLFLVALVIAGPFLVALLVRGQPWRSAGLGTKTLSPSIQLGLALAVITIFLRGKIYTLIDGISSSEVLLLAAFVMLGFAEEFAFRGYVQPRLSAWWGERVGWVSAALLYTLWRIPQQILVYHVRDPQLLAISLFDLLVFALIQGWIMRKCGNVVAPAMYNAFHSWVMFI
jgi:membrane protease YdiL (CAAX protease family)